MSDVYMIPKKLEVRNDEALSEDKDIMLTEGNRSEDYNGIIDKISVCL